MSMPPESNLERRCRLETERRGGRLLKFVSPGNKGVPDRLLLMPFGFLAFIEFKRAEKAKDQPLQGHWQQWLNDHMHRAYRIWQYNDFLVVLNEAGTVSARR